MAKARLVISSATQIAHMINANPNLLTIPGLAGLANASRELAKATSSGGCSSCSKNFAPAVNLQDYRHTFESTIQGLTTADLMKMKDMLKLDEICYHARTPQGSLEVKCL